MPHPSSNSNVLITRISSAERSAFIGEHGMFIQSIYIGEAPCKKSHLFILRVIRDA